MIVCITNMYLCFVLKPTPSITFCLQVKYYPCKMARGRKESTCKAVLCQTCYDKLNGVIEETTGRARKRAVTMTLSLSAPKETKFKKDSNGCCHKDPSFFQLETSALYYDPTWRNKPQNANKLLSEQCLKCPRKIWHQGERMSCVCINICSTLTIGVLCCFAIG